MQFKFFSCSSHLNLWFLKIMYRNLGIIYSLLSLILLSKVLSYTLCLDHKSFMILLNKEILIMWCYFYFGGHKSSIVLWTRMGINYNPHLQMKNLSFKEIKWPVSGHTTRKRKNQDLKSSFPDSKVSMPFTLQFCLPCIFHTWFYSSLG